MRLLSIVGRCGRWLCWLRRLRDYQTFPRNSKRIWPIRSKMQSTIIVAAPGAALLCCVAARGWFGGGEAEFFGQSQAS